jgi:hypothetical protein
MKSANAVVSEDGDIVVRIGINLVDQLTSPVKMRLVRGS